VAGGRAQAGTVRPLGRHLGIQGWTVVEPRDADAAFLIVDKTRRSGDVEARNRATYQTRS
jgi:hypothetical protein